MDSKQEASENTAFIGAAPAIDGDKGTEANQVSK